MWNLDLSMAIQAERSRDVERRTREWRLLHPDPVEEAPVASQIVAVRRRPSTGQRPAATGSAREAV